MKINTWSYLIPLIMNGIPSFQVFFGSMDVFIPLTGRMGVFVWSDILLSFLLSFLLTLILLPLIPWSHKYHLIIYYYF